MSDETKTQAFVGDTDAARAVYAELDRGPIVYCASPAAIMAATIAYRKAAGELANTKGLAAALIAAHAPERGLDRSVCLRDLVEAPERAIHVFGGDL